MVLKAFPWTLVFSIAMALAMAIYGGLRPRGRPALGVFMGSLFSVAFVLALTLAALGVSWEAVPSIWNTELFSLASSGPVLRLGLRLEPAAVLMCWVALALYLYVFILESVFLGRSEQKSANSTKNVTFEAAALGLAATALAWFSSSLWTALLGQVLAMIAGARVYLRLASSDRSADLSRIFLSDIRERGCGLILMVFGAAISAASGASLDWVGLSGQTIPEMGVTLIVLGVMLQAQIFPAFGWSRIESQRTPTSARVRLLVSSPALWVGFATLYKLSAVLSESYTGLFFGVLAATLLTALSALGVSGASCAFGLIQSSLVGMSMASLFVAGARTSAVFFLISQLTVWAAALFFRGAPHISESKVHRRIWAGFLVALAFGGPGFASAAALQGLLASSGGAFGILLVSVTWIALAMAFMRLTAHHANDLTHSVDEKLGLSQAASTAFRVSPVVLVVLFSLAILWCSDPLGSVGQLEGSLGLSWSERFFGSNAVAQGETFQIMLWVWMGLLTLAVSLGLPDRLAGMKMRFLRLPSEGYSFASVLDGVVVQATKMAEALLGAGVWGFFPAFLFRLTRRIAAIGRAVKAFDRLLVQTLEEVVRTLVEVPAKAVQLAHTGSIQVYLLFTVGLALSMLLHFFVQLTR
ncbi:MAG: hypothetical protein KGQ59_06775 [Bdellovibrionales bacterium]|nr:hypothetical protein [Bdellovibrionales bacterium]